jgi:hypothetical protein
VFVDEAAYAQPSNRAFIIDYDTAMSRDDVVLHPGLNRPLVGAAFLGVTLTRSDC